MKATGLLKRIPDVILGCSIFLFVCTLAYSSYRYYSGTMQAKQTGSPSVQEVVTGPDIERAKALQEAQRTGESATYDYVTDTMPLPLVGSM